MAAYVRGRVVLITGAGGSIGAELCRQLARVGPKQLVLVENAENSLFEIRRQLEEERHFIARGRRAGRLQGRDAHARAVHRAPAVGRLPRRGLQARAADGGEPGRGRAQQRRGHPHRGGGRRRGGSRALRSRLDRQGREPGHGDGRIQGARRVGGRGGPGPLPGHPLRGGAVRQRARLVGLGRPDLPPADRRRRPGDGHRRQDDPLLHDHPRGGPADHPLRRAGRGRGGLRARDGRAGEDHRPRPQHDPAVRERAGRGHSGGDRRAPAGGEAARGAVQPRRAAAADAGREDRQCRPPAARAELGRERLRPDRGARLQRRCARPWQAPWPSCRRSARSG